MNPFLGQIVLFAGNFAPRGWAFCQGQLLSIAQNSALFSILGTTYGGDGRTTFALPDLRGREAFHPGTGPGLSTFRLGDRGGLEQTQLTLSTLPAHAHDTSAAISGAPGTTQDPSGAVAAHTAEDSYGTASTTKAGPATGSAGNNSPTSFSNRPPYLALNYIIATQGTFPSRS